MPLYEERLSKDLTRIRDGIALLGLAVQKAQEDAMQSTLTGNRPLGNQTIIRDHPINRKAREINRLCHAFLATHSPGAGHLRLISSILRLVNELERIGDYAVTIAREGLQLPHLPTGLLKQEMEEMAAQAQKCFHNAMKSFNEKDVALARETLTLSARGKGLGDLAFEDLIREGKASHQEIRYLFDSLILVGRLKRVCDRCKNICEETLFSLTGETKAAKCYNVLFLDNDNSCQSQIAEAFARKTFPNSGRYTSAGKTNGAELKPGLNRFLDTYGLIVEPIKIKTIEPDPAKASEYDVVVSLQGPTNAYFSQQPFRTVFLDWDVGLVPEELGEAEAAARYSELYREIAARVRDLMETLRGEEAD